jgi:hypothetical protein
MVAAQSRAAQCEYRHRCRLDPWAGADIPGPAGDGCVVSEDPGVIPVSESCQGKQPSDCFLCTPGVLLFACPRQNCVCGRPFGLREVVRNTDCTARLLCGCQPAKSGVESRWALLAQGLARAQSEAGQSGWFRARQLIVPVGPPLSRYEQAQEPLSCIRNPLRSLPDHPQSYRLRRVRICRKSGTSHPFT